MCFVTEAGKLDHTAVFQSEIDQETRESSSGRGAVVFPSKTPCSPTAAARFANEWNRDGDKAGRSYEKLMSRKLVGASLFQSARSNCR